MNIAIIGYGQMGKKIDALATANGYTITHRINNLQDLQAADFEPDTVAIEFSRPESCINNVRILSEKGINTVIGTTGWYDDMAEIEKISLEHNVGILWSANFSLGVNIFAKILEPLSAALTSNGYGTKLHEIHHTKKKDAPSGTGIMLAERINFPVEQITSAREGEVRGIHTVIFENAIDSITITHSAKSRDGFALGSIACADWLNGKQGFYGMEDYLAESLPALFLKELTQK
jgi:4-hydroxy-tetrahydrodipicolinate reductase